MADRPGKVMMDDQGMTRRELQDIVGFEIAPKMVMVAGPDGQVYGCCADGSWHPYQGIESTGVVGGVPNDVPVTPQEDAAWAERRPFVPEDEPEDPRIAVAEYVREHGRDDDEWQAGQDAFEKWVDGCGP